MIDLIDERHKNKKILAEYSIKIVTEAEDIYDYILVPIPAHQIIDAIENLKHLSGKFII